MTHSITIQTPNTQSSLPLLHQPRLRSLTKYILLTGFALALGGCGGGGGGGVSSNRSAGCNPLFASFPLSTDLKAGDGVCIDGVAQIGSYSLSGSIVGDSSLGPVGDATVNLTFKADKTLQKASIKPAGDTAFSWDTGTTPATTSENGSYNNVVDVLRLSKAGASALIANPYSSKNGSSTGWNYQTFGTWVDGNDSGNGRWGSFSVGSATVASNIPTSGPSNGVVQYSGKSLGRWVNSSGSQLSTTSTMTATVKLSTREVWIDFTLTQSEANALAGLNVVGTNQNLNFSTNGFTYSESSNRITGNITGPNGLSGTIDAKFYGPTAQEIGGTFTLTGSGQERYTGSFGGKQP